MLVKFVSWIAAYVLSWITILPLAVQVKIQTCRQRAYEVLLNLLDKSKILNKSADAALELHAITRGVYLSIEELARQNHRFSSLWDHHLKFPLNSALWSLKYFSRWLQSQAQEWEITNTDMGQLVMDAYVIVDVDDGYTSFLTDFNHFRDLSSEIRLLGDFPAARGVVSSIWLGELSGGTKVAVKLLIPGHTVNSKEVCSREANIWSRAMHHENIMPLLGIARLCDSVALISPWMPEGNLRTFLKSNPDANRLQLLADVARGLAYIHSQGIVYGNLLPSTILVSSAGRAYLSSFLVARTQDRDEFCPIESQLWPRLSPEFLLADHAPHSLERIVITPQSDSFAFGSVVMETLMDTSPYTQNRRNAVRQALRGELPERPRFLDRRGLTDDLWQLVIGCWHRDPAKRPSMAEVAHKMVLLAEAFTPLLSDFRSPPRTLKDISAEIKKFGEHPIAGGGYCDLYLGERLGSERVALKLVRLLGSTGQDKEAARRRFLSEAHLWAEFDHPRILEFYGICEYGTMSLFMVSPYLKHGNIMAFLVLEPDADRLRLLSETAEGLLYLHSRSPPVVHGDMKGANILITDTGHACLADFGLSKISHEATTTVLQGAGSPRWMAPELILAGDDTTGPLKSQKSDIYAYGHVMLEVLSNKKPFFNLKEDLHVVVELIHGGRSPRPDGPVAEKWLNDTIWTFIQRLTAVDPEERPGIETVARDFSRLHHYPRAAP